MAKEWWDDAPLAEEVKSDTNDWWKDAKLADDAKPKGFFASKMDVIKNFYSTGSGSEPEEYSDPMGTGNTSSAAQESTQKSSGSIIMDGRKLDAPNVDAVKNRQARDKSGSADSIMFQPARDLDAAESVINRTKRRETLAEEAASTRRRELVKQANFEANDASRRLPTPDVFDPMERAKAGEEAVDATDRKTEFRMPSEIAQDTAAAGLKIGPTALKSLAQIFAMGTGGLVGEVTADQMSQGMKSIDETIGSKTSEKERVELSRLLESKDANASDVAAYIASKPMLMADMGITTVGSMFVPAGVTGLLGKLSKAPMSGAAATAISNITNSAMNAADTFSETDGDNRQKYLAAAIAGLGSYGVGKVTGGGAEGMLSRQVAGAKSAKPIRDAITGALIKEPGQEYVENVAQKVGQNIGEEKSIDWQRAHKEGVLGAVIAPLVSAPVSIREARSGSPRNQAIQELQNALNAPLPTMEANFAKTNPNLATKPTAADIVAPTVTTVDQAVETFNASVSESATANIGDILKTANEAKRTADEQLIAQIKATAPVETIAEQAINTPATPIFEAKNALSQAATQAQAIEAGAPAGIAPEGQPAANTTPRAGVVETSRLNDANPVQANPTPTNAASAVPADTGRAVPDGGVLPAARGESTVQSEPKMAQGVPETVQNVIQTALDISTKNTENPTNRITSNFGRTTPFNTDTGTQTGYGRPSVVYDARSLDIPRAPRGSKIEPPINSSSSRGGIDARSDEQNKKSDNGNAFVSDPRLVPVSQRTPASWLIRDKSTGAVVAETFDKKKVDALNTQKYEAVPITEHLASLSNKGEPTAVQAQPTPKAIEKAPLTEPQRKQVNAANEQQLEDLYQQDVKDAISARLGRPTKAAKEAGRTPFKSFLREHGINSSVASDVTGERGIRANARLPATFRRNGLNLDLLAERAVEAGFMTQAELDSADDNGGTNRLVQMIQAEISGKPQETLQESNESNESQAERIQRAEIEGMADKLGFPYDGDTSTDRLASMVKRVSDRLEAENLKSWGDTKIGKLKEERVLQNAKDFAARVERKRVQYERELDGFAQASIKEQDALLEVLYNADGNPTIVRQADIQAEAAWNELNGQWEDQNGQANTTANGAAQEASASDNRGTRTSAENAREVSTEPQQSRIAEEGLTAPTREDILAQQDRAAEAEKSQAANDKAKEKAAKEAADKKEIDARQAASADNFQLGQSAEDSLSGQASMLDVPADKPASAMSVQDLLRAAAQKMDDAAKPQATEAEVEKAAEKLRDDAEAKQLAKPLNIIDAESTLWSRLTEGTASLDEFKDGFNNWVSNKESILEAFSKLKKDNLLKMGGSTFAYRNKSENKATIAESLWRDGVSDYVLGRSFQFGMGKDAFVNGVRAMVEKTDAEQLAQFAAERKSAKIEAVARVEKITEAIKDPKTLDDYRTWMRATMTGGKTFKDARMALTPEQRAAFDEMTASESRNGRKASKDEQRSNISVAGQNVDGSIIATKHTKKGHDVFVVQLSERVSKEDYNTINTGAKRIGGYYSSFRGAGATPGFQFTDRAQAEAFVKLANGDNTYAQAAAKANRNAFEDDSSQTAVERLTEMAEQMDERAQMSLNQKRKENTYKRARQAASAEAAANADKATAKTMRNIAQAVAEGSAKFLDRVRQKTQIEALQSHVSTARYDELRAKYDNYADQEKYRGEAPTTETADYAEFPTFSAYRSDLATLARQLVTVDGTKLMGQKLLKVADDVSDAFNAFAKENTAKLMAFRKKDGSLAAFSSRESAERSIEGSGFKGKALVHMVKRGEYILILSPSEAIERGVWQGDGDQRITLSPDFGAEMVEKIGKAARRGAKVSVPWQLESAHDRRKLLSRMGIETPAEFRSALREFIGLQEQAAAPDKVKQLERAMTGRSNDGLDFFPTPENVVDEMLAAAGIESGMTVLEPSAGWGHIAERIRTAGVDPDVGEMSSSRRELLEAKGFKVVSNDFMELTKEGGYDRIVMNPPFSDGRDIQHVQHAYTLLKPGGRIVAIMGESAFTNQNKRATEFREWLDQMGGTEEKLAEGSFNDPSLPVNTGANARMVVIEKSAGAIKFNRDTGQDAIRFAKIGENANESTNPSGNSTLAETMPRGRDGSATEREAAASKSERPLFSGSFSAELSRARTDPAQFQRTALVGLGRVIAREIGVAEPSIGAYSPAKLVNIDELNQIAKVFGKEIIGFKQNSANPAMKNAFGFFSGVSVGGDMNDLIFISRDNTRPHLSLLGHELVHTMRRDNPALYNELVNVVNAYTKTAYYKSNFGNEPVARGLTDDVAIREEFMGEVLSDGFTDVNFWNAVAAKNKTLFERIVGALGKLIDRVRTSFGQQRRTEKYLTDFDKVMTLAGEVMAKYGVSNKTNTAEDVKYSSSKPVQTDTPAFKSWFGDSKVVDAAGKPLVVYHGTTNDIAVFDPSKTKAASVIFTTPDADGASTYAEARFGGNANVMPLYVSIKNPSYINADDYSFDALQSALASASVDGVLVVDTEGKIKIVAPVSATQIKSATGNNGNFNPDNPDIRYARNAPDAVPAESKWQGRQRVVQDKFNRFKVLQNWLTENGITLSEGADVYQAETLMSGRIASRKEDFREKQMQPLIAKTQKAGISMEDIGDYLKAQHAPEANKRARELHNDETATAFGVTDDEAKATIDEFKKQANFAELKDLANEWRDITTQTKQILLDGGILSKDMVAAWDATYSAYIPVKGSEESQGTGKGLSVNGKTKRRMRHGLRDEAILENILRDHERAIQLDEKNNVGKALIRFALEAKNDDIITVGQPEKRQIMKAGEVMLQASPMLAENEVNVYIDGHAVRVQINDEIAARAYTALGVEHLNTVLSAGRQVNTWLSKAYTGYSPDFILTNPIRDAIQGSMTLTGEYGAGMAAKIFTHYPKAVKELVKHFNNHGASQLVNDYRANGGSTGAAYLSDLERIGNDLQASYDEYAGVMDTYSRAYEQAVQEGKKAPHTYAAMRSGIAGIKKVPVVGHFLRLMESVNSITENALRVATYDTLVKDGVTPGKAATQAKNLMNFNRKGEIANTAGAMYLFFNPSVQGSQVMFKALVESEHKGQVRALAGMMVLSAMALAELAMSGGADDEEKWKNTPDYVKDGNAVVGFGDKQFTLTLPYGYRVFHTLGNVISDYMHGGDGYKLGIRLASSVFANFSPVGNPMEGSVQGFSVVPTVPKMLLGPSVNQDSFGREITPKSWSNTKPDSQIMNLNTRNTAYASMAKGMNDLTGGTDYKKGLVDVSPETLKYWVNSLTGGAGKAAMDMINIPKATYNEVPLALKDIPVARRFVREVGVSDSRSAFWERVKEAKEAADSFAAAKKAHDSLGMQEILRDNKALLAMDKYADHQQKLIKAKRDETDRINADKNLTPKQKNEKIKLIEMQETAVYKRFIQTFDEKTKK